MVYDGVIERDGKAAQGEENLQNNIKWTAEYGPCDVAYVYRSDDENVRYRVEYDHDSEDPREWDQGLEVLTYAAGHGVGPDTLSSASTAASRAFRYAYEELNMRDTEAAKFANRFSHIFGTGEVLTLHSWSGYVQSDWWYTFIVTPPNHDGIDAASMALACEQWACGDVYSVSREIREVCDQGYAHWEEDEYSYELGGIYASTETDAAREFDANF